MDKRTERRFRDIAQLCDRAEVTVYIRRKIDYARRRLEDPARVPRSEKLHKNLGTAISDFY